MRDHPRFIAILASTVALVHGSFFCLDLAGLAWCQPTSAPIVAERRYAVHHGGLQWLGMSNDGEFGNPGGDTLWVPELEYPGESGTVFLFSGGLWVGATVDGQPHVSTCTDSNNGTNEFGALELATPADRADSAVHSVSWLERRPVADSEARQRAKLEGRYLGVGIMGIDDDGDGRIDEDPAGDISADFIDNDGDGLIDADDPDLDGDRVPGSCDDDGDGLIDEDDAAWATQELVTVMVDTCAACVENPGDDHWPLGIKVVQHSFQWSAAYADDILLIRYSIANIGGYLLEDVCLATFFDFDVGHLSQEAWDRSEDDITYFFDDIRMAVGADNDGDEGLLSSRAFGVRFVETPIPDPPFTYKNLNRLTGGDPIDDYALYSLMVSGVRDADERRNIGDWRMVLAVGPLGDLGPGEVMTAAIAIVNGFDDQHLWYGGITAEQMLDPDFAGPTPPHAPRFLAEPHHRSVLVVWDDEAEGSFERAVGYADFQGYNIWRTVDGEEWTLVATYDLPDTIGLNMGWPSPAGADSGYAYEYLDRGLMNGARLRYVVTAFDDGNNGDGIHNAAWTQRRGLIGVLESSRDAAQLAIPAEGAISDGDLSAIVVVPNPYRGSSRLEIGQPGRLVEFRVLPPVCTIQIYTLAGDFIRELRHTSGLSWEAWDLKNADGREVAGGIYLYRIKAASAEHTGKFLIVR